MPSNDIASAVDIAACSCQWRAPRAIRRGIVTGGYHATRRSSRRPPLLSSGRKGYPSETNVKHGLRFVRGGEVELIEKLGRKDRCPCGSGLSFQTLLPAIRPVSTGRTGGSIGGSEWAEVGCSGGMMSNEPVMTMQFQSTSLASFIIVLMLQGNGINDALYIVRLQSPSIGWVDLP